MSWETVLGFLTGVRLLAPEIDAETLLRTVFVVHLCDAVVCALYARDRGYSKLRWALAGFVFGIWAVAAIIVLSACRRSPR
ncbi:MAG: hypothetical protein KatS3mg076_2692 [Candidatus Binatia bacterium]|nr:MAG: hypothetical protein KatS3mg076_2692 [Candidatus Binatia bacterium]